MATLKQIEANRRNASLSTGPRTPEGKAAVRFNALIHGLRSCSVVLPDESHHEFQQLFDDFLSDLQPQGPTELALVEQMAIAQWKLARCESTERYLFESARVYLERHSPPQPGGSSLQEVLGLIIESPSRAKSLEYLSAWQSRLERSFFRALRELGRLQTARRRQPEPPPCPPEENPADPPPPDHGASGESDTAPRPGTPTPWGSQTAPASAWPAPVLSSPCTPVVATPPA